MLRREWADWLVAPANAVPAVKAAVRLQGGYVSDQPHGHGVGEGLVWALAASGQDRER
jgi:hydroxymethylpyrimidine pyrophosphatase-like HAD family hydrolase